MAPDKIVLSTVFAGQNVGVKQVGDQLSFLVRVLSNLPG